MSERLFQIVGQAAGKARPPTIVESLTDGKEHQSNVAQSRAEGTSRHDVGQALRNVCYCGVTFLEIITRITRTFLQTK